MTITDLCYELRNWFDVSKHFGSFEIESGTLDLDFLCEGQFFRIIGSKFNDGVHKYKESQLEDETFSGAIWVMNVPPAVLNLLDDINAFETKNADVIDSPYTSESINGGFYSYTKDNDSIAWQKKFAKRLNMWRKI